MPCGGPGTPIAVPHVSRLWAGFMRPPEVGFVSSRLPGLSFDVPATGFQRVAGQHFQRLAYRRLALPARFRFCRSLPRRSAAYCQGNARWSGRRRGQAETGSAPVRLRPPDISGRKFGQRREARASAGRNAFGNADGRPELSQIDTLFAATSPATGKAISILAKVTSGNNRISRSLTPVSQQDYIPGRVRCGVHFVTKRYPADRSGRPERRAERTQFRYRRRPSRPAATSASPRSSITADAGSGVGTGVSSPRNSWLLA